MEGIYESMVLHYLTHRGDVFACPQFPLAMEPGATKYPDFVVLNCSTGMAEIVEASVAYTTKLLEQRVRMHCEKGIPALAEKLKEWKLAEKFKKIGVRVFVRKNSIASFQKLREKGFKVEAELIDNVFKRWEWAVEKLEADSTEFV